VTSARIPRLAVAAWTAAAVITVVLVVAVVHYLSRARHGAMGEMSMTGAGHDLGAALTRAGAHGPSTPLWGSTLVSAWQLDAVALAVLVPLAAAYLTGVALLPIRSRGTCWPLRRTVAFLAGLAVCAFATCGSIAVYDQVLFTAHMAGHLALVMVAPALLACGRPLTLAVAAAPPARRARLERIAGGRALAVLTAPPLALASYAAVIVGSHLTGLMDTIMRNTWAGQVEHLVYVLAGYQFFVLVIGGEPIRWRLGSPARWLLLAIAMAVDTFTGIVLMQGTHAIAVTPSRLAVDALSDTHNGGAVMWFGGDAIMAVVMIALVINWLRTIDTAPPERGWLEQARTATFVAHTGGDGTGAVTEIDEDDEARSAYNDWLARLERHR
jgi:putative copper resistance protein D